MRIDLFLLFLFLFSPFVHSDTHENQIERKIEETLPSLFSETEMEAEDGDDFQSKFLRMLVILALLIAFMIVASLALKRMMHAKLSTVNQKSQIKVVETRTLSPRTTLYVLEKDDKSLLIAETASSVTLLSSAPSSNANLKE